MLLQLGTLMAGNGWQGRASKFHRGKDMSREKTTGTRWNSARKTDMELETKNETRVRFNWIR